MTWLAISAADISLKTPPKEPKGVRLASTIKTSVIVLLLI
jgi:hypothetical protein